MSSLYSKLDKQCTLTAIPDKFMSQDLLFTYTSIENIRCMCKNKIIVNNTQSLALNSEDKRSPLNYI